MRTVIIVEHAELLIFPFWSWDSDNGETSSIQFKCPTKIMWW